MIKLAYIMLDHIKDLFLLYIHLWFTALKNCQTNYNQFNSSRRKTLNNGLSHSFCFDCKCLIEFHNKVPTLGQIDCFVIKNSSVKPAQELLLALVINGCISYLYIDERSFLYRPKRRCSRSWKSCQVTNVRLIVKAAFTVCKMFL